MAISPQKTHPKVKLTGKRSIESKLSRLAYEFEEDALRVRVDHNNDLLADALLAISSQLGKIARAMRAGE